MPGIGLPKGTIDLHVHSAPDVRERPFDDLELARRCREAGLAGAVIKSHVEPSASRAFLVTAAVPGVQMYGGIALNRAVGGLNADAVEAMAQGTGRRGRIVWLPTRDAENEKARKERPGPVVRVTEDGSPVPELNAVLEVVAAHDLVLASGHVAPAEAAAIFRRAREAGCRRLLVTHATAPVSTYSPDELDAMVGLGAWIELCARNLFKADFGGAMVVDRARVERVASVIRNLGAGVPLVSSDLGDARYPPPDEGLTLAAEALVAAGLHPDRLDELFRLRPREVLGLE